MHEYSCRYRDCRGVERIDLTRAGAKIPVAYEKAGDQFEGVRAEATRAATTMRFSARSPKAAANLALVIDASRIRSIATLPLYLDLASVYLVCWLRPRLVFATTELITTRSPRPHLVAAIPRYHFVTPTSSLDRRHGQLITFLDQV
jgi:hypothetical protein